MLGWVLIIGYCTAWMVHFARGLRKLVHLARTSSVYPFAEFKGDVVILFLGSFLWPFAWAADATDWVLERGLRKLYGKK